MKDTLKKLLETGMTPQDILDAIEQRAGYFSANYRIAEQLFNDIEKEGGNHEYSKISRTHERR